MIKHNGQLVLDLDYEVEKSGIFTLSSFYTGAQLIFGELFRSLKLPVGRSATLLKQLVITRIIYPASKSKTSAFLTKHLGSEFSLEQIYYLLDIMHKKKSQINKRLSNYVKKQYPGHLNYLLYDVTTMYFEKDDDDPDTQLKPGLRKKGSTLIDAVVKASSTIGSNSITVVCDAAMLSEKNLEVIKEKAIGFIISTRIKNLNIALTDKIITNNYKKTPILETTYNDNHLIVSYCSQRARADKKR